MMTSSIIKLNHQEYELIRKISEGTYGQVWLVKDLHNDTVDNMALKIVERRRKNPGFSEVVQKVQHELDILHLLSTIEDEHSPFLRLIDSELIETDDKVTALILTEYLPGLDLFDFVQRVLATCCNRWAHWPMTRESVLQMAQAVKRLHEHQIIHNDIKLENFISLQGPSFLKRKQHLVLIDFGFSRSDHQLLPAHNMPFTDGGSFHYISPEAYRGPIKDFKSAVQSEVWSLGVVIYTMTYRLYPYGSKQQEYWRERIALDPSPFDSLFKSIFVVEPSNRPTVDEVIKMINLTPDKVPVNNN